MTKSYLLTRAIDWAAVALVAGLLGLIAFGVPALVVYAAARALG